MAKKMCYINNLKKEYWIDNPVIRDVFPILPPDSELEEYSLITYFTPNEPCIKVEDIYKYREEILADISKIVDEKIDFIIIDNVRPYTLRNLDEKADFKNIKILTEEGDKIIKDITIFLETRCNYVNTNTYSTGNMLSFFKRTGSSDYAAF